MTSSAKRTLSPRERKRSGQSICGILCFILSLWISYATITAFMWDYDSLIYMSFGQICPIQLGVWLGLAGVFQMRRKRHFAVIGLILVLLNAYVIAIVLAPIFYPGFRWAN
jgi:hypothetical protein